MLGRFPPIFHEVDHILMERPCLGQLQVDGDLLQPGSTENHSVALATVK